MLFHDLVQLGDLSVELVVAHRRQADPQNRNMRLTEGVRDGLDALAVDVPPTIGQRIETLAAFLDRLYVVEADLNDDKIDMDFVAALGDEIMRSFDPVVEIVTHKTGGIARSAVDGDFRIVRESLAQTIGGEKRKTVADHVDKESGGDRRTVAAGARRLCRHEIAFFVCDLMGRGGRRHFLILRFAFLQLALRCIQKVCELSLLASRAGPPVA